MKRWILVSVAVMGLSLLACGGDDAAPPAAGAAGKGGSGGAAGKAGSGGSAGKGGSTAGKVAPKKTAPKGTASKGGQTSSPKQPTAGATTKKTAPGSTTTASTSTSGTQKQTPAGDNPCADASLEGVAVCSDEQNLAFCSGGELYVAQCGAVMAALYPDAGYNAGACVETETYVDCLGCAAFDDGSVYCCTNDGQGAGDICCDGSGACFEAGAPAGGTPTSKYSFCDSACGAQSPVSCPYYTGEGQACLTQCEAEFDKNLQGKSGCMEAAVAYINCGLALPAESLECDAEGEAVPKDGACGAELSAVQACLGGG